MVTERDAALSAFGGAERACRTLRRRVASGKEREPRTQTSGSAGASRQAQACRDRPQLCGDRSSVPHDCGLAGEQNGIRRAGRFHLTSRSYSGSLRKQWIRRRANAGRWLQAALFRDSAPRCKPSTQRACSSCRPVNSATMPFSRRALKVESAVGIDTALSLARSFALVIGRLESASSTRSAELDDILSSSRIRARSPSTNAINAFAVSTAWLDTSSTPRMKNLTQYSQSPSKRTRCKHS